MVAPSSYGCTGTAPISYSYTWSDSTTGATATGTTDGTTNITDTLSAADVGQTVSVTVTASNSTGPATPERGAAVGPVTGPPVNSPAPTITGTPVQEGHTLTAHPGNWGGYPPPTYTYSWSDGTTGLTDTLSAADVGKAVTFTEAASNPLGTVSASVKTAIVKGPPTNTVAPTISGYPVVGATVTADPGAWTDYPTLTTYTYSWSDGTTTQTDTIPATDLDKTLTVTVTATNSVGFAAKMSAGVGPVAASATAPQNTSQPTISGTAQQGATLTANPGGWSGTLPISYSYAWSDGTTGPTDTLSATDVGTYVSVTVTASNIAGGAAATSTSLGPVSPPGLIATTTAVAASPNPAVTNQVVTLIATVTSSNGLAPPSGTITFKNGGAAISGCANVAVAPSAQSVTVTCETSFAASTVQLTAAFAPSPGSNLTASASPADSVVVDGNPPVLRSITSTMQWSFHYTPTYTGVMALVVNGASGATVQVKCQGKGCPFASRAAVVARTRRCETKGKHTCSTHGTVDLTSQFRSRHLHVGTVITVLINRRGWIGKYYSFTVRARQAPRVRITCLAPGGTRPGAGC